MTRGRSTQDIAVAALPRGRGNPIGGIVLMTLALLTAVAPFGIDLYLPAFPAMKAELSTTATGVQLSLTAFLIGAAIGQVIFGPWSDRVGRDRKSTRLNSITNAQLVCRLLLEKQKNKQKQ